MTFVALLRAVNVGGTGKIAMGDLKAFCEDAGFANVRTYIASGNVVFDAKESEAHIKAAIEKRIARHFGKPVGVMVRTGAELAKIVAGNPFPKAPGNRVAAIFLDDRVSTRTLDGMKGGSEEEVRLGVREIYVHYGDGMAHSKLVIPAAKQGTARNMNTIAKLAEMAGG